MTDSHMTDKAIKLSTVTYCIDQIRNVKTMYYKGNDNGLRCKTSVLQMPNKRALLLLITDRLAG